MKLVGSLLAATLLFYLFSPSSVNAQATHHWKGSSPGKANKSVPTEINYTVEVIDMQRIAGVNKHREITGTVGTNIKYRGAFLDRKQQTTSFDCIQFDRSDETNTTPVSINNHGQIVGSCDSGTFGFVRDRGGKLAQFSVPGADGTTPFGINDHGQIVGERYNPLTPGLSGWYRFKSFLRQADGSITLIEAPPHSDDTGFPNSLTRTEARGINNRGQIVGTYGTIFTPSNEGGLHDAFIYDNGQFKNLPKGINPIAINNHGQILASREQGDFVIYDDGQITKINNPPGYVWASISGLNDNGQLVGQVRENVVRSLKFFRVIATPVGGVN
jgi:uncharacterized membrane protein